MPQLPTLLIQVVVILLVARLVGWIFRRIHQPQVIGEMAAGILLGPSLLGWVSPAISSALFPIESLGFLNSLSQVGLLFFMFLVGMELDGRRLLERRHTAVLTSHVSIIFPFLLGTLAALYLYPRLSDERVKFVHFALFLGAAMSVTAFPVLARILTERRLLGGEVGAVAVACAAVGDVTAWCLLAAVVVLVRAYDSLAPLWLTVFGSAAYIAAMLLVIRRVLIGLQRMYEKRSAITQDLMALILLLVFGSAWVTEQLGIHALFGAFLIGVIMPKEAGFKRALSGKLEDLTVVLFLPLFFAFTGLRTRIGLVHGGDMWFYCALIIAVAIVGKFGGAALAARLTGMSWREAGAIGILMNTRGLIELVILNIGLEIGVISPAVFAMMVLMALVTTVMTAPLLDLIYPPRLRRRDVSDSGAARAA